MDPIQINHNQKASASETVKKSQLNIGKNLKDCVSRVGQVCGQALHFIASAFKKEQPSRPIIAAERHPVPEIAKTVNKGNDISSFLKLDRNAMPQELSPRKGLTEGELNYKLLGNLRNERKLKLNTEVTTGIASFLALNVSKLTTEEVKIKLQELRELEVKLKELNMIRKLELNDLKLQVEKGDEHPRLLLDIESLETAISEDIEIIKELKHEFQTKMK